MAELGVTEDLVETVSELMVPKHSGPAWDSHSAATKRLLIENYEPTARAVLAAVVPEVQAAILRQAADAWGDGSEGFPHGWLHDRADEIAAGKTPDWSAES